MLISLDAISKVSEMIACLALVATGIFGYRKYKQTKQKERLQKDFEMRRDFILHPKLSRMQGIIEHQTAELTALLRKLTVAEDPHALPARPLLSGSSSHAHKKDGVPQSSLQGTRVRPRCKNCWTCTDGPRRTARFPDA